MAEVIDYPAILDEAWQQHLAPRKADAPTVVSLFAGCGGSSLGYSMAGYRELLAVEWNDNAVATFKLNFPDVPVYHGDIAKLSVEKCLELAGLEPGQLDVLDGSPPCQGFSTAGKRQLDDPRNSLAMEFVRLLRGLKPKAFIMENVSGLVKGKMKLVFAEIMRELKASGYQVSCRLMNAKWFQVPQSRARLIWIGIRDNLEIESESVQATSRLISVRQAIGDLSDKGKVLTPMAAKYWPRMKLGEGASKYHPKGHYFGLIKIDPSKPHPTLTKHSGIGKPCHWQEKRFLGNQERARISSYPDNYYWQGKWTNVFDLVGNSVPPLFMRAIALHVRGLLEQSGMGLETRVVG